MSQKLITPAVEAELQKLMDEDPSGLLRPEAMVKVAKNPNNVLHDEFTWEDDKAAEQWRIQEARQLIQTWVMREPHTKETVRVLTSLDNDRTNGGGFRWTTEVIERPDLREQLVQTALRELTVTETRYKHLNELATVWESIDKAKGD